MKLTALIENQAKGPLLSEHGLSVHIEYNGKAYLLDTGSSDQFLINAKLLGIDLKKVTTAFLSHSHYDHSSGFEGFFEINKQAKVYLRTEAKELCYSKIGFLKKYVGIPRHIIESYGTRFEYLNGNNKIDEGVWLIPHSMENLSEKGKTAHLYRKSHANAKLLADDFRHEQSLVFEGNSGLVILNSCCHSGVDHVIEEVMQAFPDKEICAIVGGFHLMGLLGPDSMSGTKEKVVALAKRLKELGVKHIYTGHCTGTPAFNILQKELGEKLHYFSTGTTVEL